MKTWLVTFCCLFALVEFYLWIKDVTLPAPVYVMGGAFLAIASNYEKGITSFLPHSLQGSQEQGTKSEQ